MFIPDICLIYSVSFKNSIFAERSDPQRVYLRDFTNDQNCLAFSFFLGPFCIYLLVSSLEIIGIGNTGNQNHPDLEVRVVLVTCISNAGNQPLMQSSEWNLNLNSLLVTRQTALFHQGVTETSSPEVNTPNHPKHFKTIQISRHS